MTQLGDRGGRNRGLPGVLAPRISAARFRVRRYEMISRLSIMLFLTLPLCAQVKFTQGKDRISVEIDGKPYTDFFLAADGNKPYVYPLRTAAGVIVTRHVPMQQFPDET